MESCNETMFKDQHGGLQKLTLVEGKDRFVIFRKNFSSLVKLLKLPSPHRANKVGQLFKTQGYYIGKEQLRCLLDKEFADFDGIQIMLGLDKDPKTATGQLTMLIKGAFGSTSTDQGTKLINGEEVDLRYFESSKTTFVAAWPLVNTTPPPNSMPMPPYGEE